MTAFGDCVVADAVPVGHSVPKVRAAEVDTLTVPALPIFTGGSCTVRVSWVLGLVAVRVTGTVSWPVAFVTSIVTLKLQVKIRAARMARTHESLSVLTTVTFETVIGGGVGAGVGVAACDGVGVGPADAAGVGVGCVPAGTVARGLAPGAAGLTLATGVASTEGAAAGETGGDAVAAGVPGPPATPGPPDPPGPDGRAGADTGRSE